MRLPKVYKRSRFILQEDSDESDDGNDNDKPACKRHRADDSDEYMSACSDNEDDFIVSDNEEIECDECSESEKEFENSDGEDQLSYDAEDDDTCDRTYGHTYEKALKIISKRKDMEYYIEAGEKGDTFCFRTRDTQPRHPCGDYQLLLRSLEKILGRTAVREDPDPNKHFMAGVQPYVVFSSRTRFSAHFFGCLCNQNPNKIGGLNHLFGMKDEKTEIVFLFGSECASRHENMCAHELKTCYDLEPVEIGPPKR